MTAAGAGRGPRLPARTPAVAAVEASAAAPVGIACSASAFAVTELQVVQLMPVFVRPQLLVCGLFDGRTVGASIADEGPDVAGGG